MREEKRGRPPIYTDEYLDILAVSLIEWVNNLAENDEFGLLSDWCFKNHFNPKYFSRYTVKHQAFKEAHSWAREWQEHIVAKGALTQKLNARFAQFFLGCNHNWRTKDPNEDKMSQLRSEFRNYLDLMKEDDDEEE